MDSLLSPPVTPYPKLGQDLTDRGREVMPPEPHPAAAGGDDVLKALH